MALQADLLEAICLGFPASSLKVISSVTFLASGNSLALWRLADMVEEMHGFAKKLQVTFCHILRRASMKHTFSQKMGQGICP